uniref:Uncharacterized protein LOC114347129 n=1 Tax=Diabrotica virgifera virgifera TaxID=50390 RepID=A0A6P7HD11_DIAVI
MKPDHISLEAKKDGLICAYVARYITAHIEKHLATVASRKMRDLAKLLIEIKKYQPSVNNLVEALQPKYFDIIVSATKIIAKYNYVEDRFESPTLALNMGTSLKQCCDIAIVLVLKRKELYSTLPAAEAEAFLKTMIHLIQTNWSYGISSRSASDLLVNKPNKITLLPLATDLNFFKEYLINTANSALEKLIKNNKDIKSYVTVLETVYCRVLLLNRRRPGELQRSPFYLYDKVIDDQQKYEEFSDIVSLTENILLQSLKRIVIKGKRGRGVPVIFSKDVQEHLSTIFRYRDNIINKNNIYLFGNPKSSKPLCGYKVLKKHVLSAQLKNPLAITSTKLRKHLATLTQLFNMTESDIEQLATFMGHTVGIHKSSYRLPDDVFQTAKISKLLLLMEKGEASQFKRMQLNEIDINLDFR